MNSSKSKNTSTNQTYKSFHSTVETVCPMCKSKHKIYMCEKYKNLNPVQRKEITQKLQLCTNCLSTGHVKIKCPSTSSCKLCKKRHHTSLHIENKDNTAKAQNIQNQPHQNSQIATNETHVHNHFAGSKGQALLATAVFKTYHKGREILLRALLDQGSQSSFITEEAAQRLQLIKQKINATIFGLGSKIPQTASYAATFTVHPRYPSHFKTSVTAIILNKLTRSLPNKEHTPFNWKHLNNIMLADPLYYKPGPIDIIFGVDILSEILLDGIIKNPEGTLMAQNTEFGWIISGKITKESCNTGNNIISLISEVNIDEQLEKFWAQKEIPKDHI